MSEKIEDRVVVKVLEQTTNLLNLQEPELAAGLMLAFVHHAAHIAMSLTDAQTVSSFLSELATHLPNCEHQTSVHRDAGTNTTKH